MKFLDGLLAVRDVDRAKAFYKKYLNQDVVVDFGANVTRTGGFSLQTLEWLHELEKEGSAGYAQ